MSDAGGPEALLEERPDLADALEAVLAVDAREETWTFDDVPVDSGPFGELVSRDVVERVGDEYRLADPDATRTAIGGEDAAASGVTVPDVSLPTLARPTLDRTTAALVTAAIAFVGLVRVHPIRSVYRDGYVVLSGNDPYYYRYWVEQAMATGSNPFDLSSLAILPNAVQKGEPLMVATLWWVAELLGDGPAVAGDVLAWFPVASAVLTAALVYLLAVATTDDRRIGLAAVLLFALIPGHALRTSLGFADHHAFDFPWLVATALALATIVKTDDLRSPVPWVASAALGIAVAGQTLAWEAGPLLILPVGLAIVGTSLANLRADRSPLARGLPVIGGVGAAAGLTALVHARAGWHTELVAYAPALLLVACLGALALAEVVFRTTNDARHLAALEAVGAVVGVLGFRALFPDFWTRLVDSLDRLFRSDAIAETQSLFDPGSFGFLFLFGFTLVLALPAMAWAIWRARDDDRWIVATVYAWYFLFLAAIQVRFVGELAAFAAVFAGVGLVWIAAWIEAAAPLDDPVERLRVPDRATLVTLTLLFLLVGSLGIVQVGVKTSQVTVEDGTYHSARFAADRSAELGQEYPDNYVLSEWGRNRVYNYFVSGESRSYGYARANFGDFLGSDHPDDWYDRFEGRVGYVVLPTTLEDVDDRTTYAHLTTGYGSRVDDRPGSGHYRALYLPPDESRIVFGVVPGATVTGNASANATVALATNVSIPREEFAYERRVTADADGTYRVRVAYPGTYRVQVDGETTRVRVSETAVRNGTTVAG